MPDEKDFRNRPEEEFREWLKSIETVDDEGKVIKPTLQDLDPDPDEDEE